jgi:hypothetical protein
VERISEMRIQDWRPLSNSRKLERMQTEPDKPSGEPSPAAAEPKKPRVTAIEPDFTRPLKPIGELLADPEFPKSALGEFVDIGGYTGVVTEIVNQSVKVRSPEGAMKSFNANGLRRIYGPAVRPEPYPEPEIPSAPQPTPSTPWVEKLQSAAAPPPSLPKVERPIEPDFSKPVKKITEFVKRPDYPQCILGEHVEIAGYSGVVVQILNRSLKVRNPGEVTRSYNADALRRLYG